MFCIVCVRFVLGRIEEHPMIGSVVSAVVQRHRIERRICAPSYINHDVYHFFELILLTKINIVIDMRMREVENI